MITAVEELRSSARIGVRTPVVVYSRNGSGKFVRFRAWTDDLSATGAKITCEQSLDGSELLVRIMLPDLKDKVIAAEVVREIDTSSRSLKLIDIRRSYYGIRFIGLAEDHLVQVAQEMDSQALSKISK